MKKILFIFLILLEGMSLSAQELIVNEFKETTDLSARTNKRLDINGSPCALVKVELPLVGVVFDQKGQVLGNVAYQTNTYWAYMPAGSKHITISHPNYHTLDVVFANYGVPYLSPSTTYVLTVTAPAIAGQPKVNTQQYVLFNITPTDANAILELDGQQVSLTDGKGSKRMPFGTYQYSIHSTMYHPFSGSVTVNDPQNKHIVNVVLNPDYGLIKVPSSGNLADASVYINGEYKGKTPYTSPKLKAGSYVVRVSKAKFNPKELTLTVGEGKTTEFLGSLSANYAAISVSVEKNAEIWINEEKKGVGTWTGDLEAGSYLIECKLTNHRTTTSEITVIPGKVQSIKMDAPIAITGTLDINCNEMDADVYLDGKKIGTTPMIVSDCLIGKHDLKITKDGKQYAQEVEVVENKEYPVNAKLQIIPNEKVISHSAEDVPQLQYTTSNSGANHLAENTIVYTANYKLDVNMRGVKKHTYENGIGTVTFDREITSINKYTLGYGAKLTSITIPNSVTSIDDGAFYYCRSLTSITIPNSVTSIGDCAFMGCENLTSITIPNSVKSIGDGAFVHCEKLTSITCEAKFPPVIRKPPYNPYMEVVSPRIVNKPGIWLYVPAESVGLYQRAEGWRDFKIIKPIEHQESPNKKSSYKNSATSRGHSINTTKTSTIEIRNKNLENNNADGIIGF